MRKKGFIKITSPKIGKKGERERERRNGIERGKKEYGYRGRFPGLRQGMFKGRFIQQSFKVSPLT